MSTAIDDAIRIARRWKSRLTGRFETPSIAQTEAVFEALAELPDPDLDQPPDAKEAWQFESDGDGPARTRRDQYILGPDGLFRIADFYGPDAHKNARAASCVPRMIAALREAERELSEAVLMFCKGGTLEGYEHVEGFDTALASVTAALKAVRYRKSG